MTGSESQIEWAQQIKARASLEFDRVAQALQATATGQSEPERTRTWALIGILEEKRAEVMAREEAGYFIVEWQELREQVRQLIAKDPRYRDIRFPSKERQHTS
jgi:hypothetical protein